MKDKGIFEHERLISKIKRDCFHVERSMQTGVQTVKNVPLSITAGLLPLA